MRNRKTKQDSKEYDSSEYDDIGDEVLKGKKVRKSFLRISTRDMYCLCGLVVVAIFVRAYKLEQPSSVVFDEVHFGGYASKYIKGRFFMDVHPPLAKLLITLAGVIGGFDGNFDFKEIGKDYLGPRVPYVTMRLLPTIMGILVIPIGYLTIKLAGFSTISAILVATLLIFENGLVTQSRLILLDSPLVASTAFTILMWVKFHNEQKRPFRFWWWVWMAMTGVGLGLTVSMKWVGLFTIAFVGLSTIKGLWDLLGDLRVKPDEWAKHFFARALCLIVIPAVLYMFFFVIHFAILSNSGDGDGFMSAEFKMTLNGHSTKDTPIDIALGSSVSIRHVNTQGGYLHSHSHNYPAGSKQQQITLYPHVDNNNLWFLENVTDPKIPYNESSPSWIRNNMIIRLNHIQTSRRLHSHDVRPPMTDADYHNEVSAYGYPGFDGDANDHWRVEIVEHDSSDSESAERLRAIHTKFRLRHMMTGCYLFSHGVKLPDWGYEQQEVTCIKGGTYPNTIWYIESNSNPSLPDDTELVNYNKPGFLRKLWELNKVMWNTNKGLTDSHPYESRPTDWILLSRGISFWSQEHRQIYLIGNPLIWWSSSIAVLLFVILKAIIILRSKRGYLDHLNVDKEHFESWAGLFFMGWILHYLPFFLMERQLFLHHYFPSLYFATLLIGIGFDLFTFRLSRRQKTIVATIFICSSILVFYWLSPLAYGNPWVKSECKSMKWVDTWDFDCNNNYETYEEYYKKSPTIEVTETSEKAPDEGDTINNVDGESKDGNNIKGDEIQEKINIEVPKSEEQIKVGQAVLDADEKKHVQDVPIGDKIPSTPQENALNISDPQPGHINNDPSKIDLTKEKIENSIQQENTLATSQSNNENLIQQESTLATSPSNNENLIQQGTILATSQSNNETLIQQGTTLATSQLDHENLIKHDTTSATSQSDHENLNQQDITSATSQPDHNENKIDNSDPEKVIKTENENKKDNSTH